MKTILLILAALPAFAQTMVPWRASVTTTVSSSGTYVFTVQQGGTNIQQLQAAVVSCGTSTFTVAQSQNGTAATATALVQTTSGTVAASANALMVMSPYPLQTPLTVTAWTASNVGVGTAISGATPFAATAVLNLSGRSFASTGTSQNYTLTVTNTGANSCSLVIDIYGSQVQ